ncbi:hypothetical protein DSOUD_3559 [Desulfuromonas soudanensis]|uniref:NRDE family protein n=1 Tax=Desulfuromonas soudanensis TaxID=1603606 RepID=A0A0M3QGR7_9BACT|nr:NRDE family protein [Desulfuromonas soudanensis]ALC18273.1 hypothetical protein DSOUD_3559 [Desulfuromonas soudanensis]
MCLILLAYRSHPDYPLILAANRDEFYDRPTAPARFWPESPRLLAGRDLRRGGTWLGVTRDGRWSAVTNVREADRTMTGGRSRGELVKGFLAGEESPEDFLSQLNAEAGTYPGFNLLAGTPENLWYLSNRVDGVRLLSPGLYGLSNALLDTPWPKVVRCRRALASALALSGSSLEADLFALLADRNVPPDSELPDTGFGLPWERLLSPPFILSPAYGTRSSTVLMVSGDGQASLIERTFSPGEGPDHFKEIRHVFPIKGG